MLRGWHSLAGNANGFEVTVLLDQSTPERLLQSASRDCVDANCVSVRIRDVLIPTRIAFRTYGSRALLFPLSGFESWTDFGGGGILRGLYFQRLDVLSVPDQLVSRIIGHRRALSFEGRRKWPPPQLPEPPTS